MKNPQRKTRAVHRWLGLVTGVQLLFWCAGGFVFSTHEIEWVRGNHGRDKSSPAGAIAASDLAAVHEVTLTTLLGKPVYRLARQGGTALVDAASGEAFTIDEAQARAITRVDRAEQPVVSRATLITGDAPTEFRGRDLPAWRVELADAGNMHVYIDQSTGVIAARRNDAWRRFDFFWMLHTMDYSGRDDFNTPWLIGFSVLGLLSVGADWAIWLFRRGRKLGRAAA